MTNSSLAHPACTVPAPARQPEGELESVSTIVPRAFPLRLSARLQRGITLAEERFEEITRLAPYVWEVPSCSGVRRRASRGEVGAVEWRSRLLLLWELGFVRGGPGRHADRGPYPALGKAGIPGRIAVLPPAPPERALPRLSFSLFHG